MKNIKILLWAVVAVFVATSCTVEHTIDYDKNMSGTNTLIIDYGEVMEQMGGLMGDSAGLDKDLDMTEGLGNLEESLGQIDGVENMLLIEDTENKRMGFAFDFQDTKALNTAMSNYLSGDEAAPSKKSKIPTTYKQKKKALILDMSNQDMGGLTESIDPSMASMLSMFDYELSINLPVAIKSVNNPIYTISEDRKSLKAIINFEDLSSGNEDLSAKIKW